MNLKTFILITITLAFSYAVTAQTDSIAKALVKHPPNGVFYSFSDFKNGVVSMRDSVTVTSTARNQKIWQGTESVTPRNSQHKREKKIKKLWGFADGKNVYVWNELEFFPLEMKGDLIRFEGYGPINYDPYAYTAVAMLFGGVGAGIYSASIVSKAKSKREYYWFDFNEGSRRGEDGFKAVEYIPDLSCHVIFYRRSKKETERELNITVNETENLDFPPDSYHKIKVFDSRLLKVCLTNDKDNCEVIDLGEDKKVYIKISETKENNNPLIEKVSDSTGEFESVKPKKNQIRN